MEVRWFCKSDQLPAQSNSAVQTHKAHELELFATTLTSISPISSIAGRAQVSIHTIIRSQCMYTCVCAFYQCKKKNKVPKHG